MVLVMLVPSCNLFFLMATLISFLPSCTLLEMKEATTTLLLLESNGHPTPVLVLKLCLQLLPVDCMVMPRVSSKALVSVLLVSSNGPNPALATTFQTTHLLPQPLVGTHHHHQPLETQVAVLLVNVNPNGDTVELEMTTVVLVAKLDLAKDKTNAVADVDLACAAPNGAIAVLDLPTVEVETVTLVRMNKRFRM